MTVLLVGPQGLRDRLREHARNAGLTIVAEAATMAEARRLPPIADAWLTVPPPAVTDDENLVEEALTPREHEVLGLLARGLSNKSIAERLGISDQTVKFHVAAVMAKLGATNRTSAVRRALERGLVTL
jgi:DNA-binding NarL/FixJ family response regulator